MSQFIITSDNKITNKQVIIIDGENSCEMINDELVIQHAIKLKPFISMDTTILIKFENKLFLIPDFILMFMKDDTNDSNLTVSYLIYCSYEQFMNKIKDNKIDVNDFNLLFKNEEDSINDISDSKFNNSVCFCLIM